MSIPPPEGLWVGDAPPLWANPKPRTGALRASSAAALHSRASSYGMAVLVIPSILLAEKHPSVIITQTKPTWFYHSNMPGSNYINQLSTSGGKMFFCFT